MRVRCIVEPSAEPPGPAPAPGPRWRARNRLAGRRGSSHIDAAARRAASRAMSIREWTSSFRKM